MNTLLEVNPSTCVFVAGPRLTVCCHRQSAAATSPSGYRDVVEAGVAAVQRLTTFASEKERADVCQRLRGTCGEDPEPAAREVVQLLRRGGCYETWLKETFGHVKTCAEISPSSTSRSSHEAVKHLLSLQQHGALLACTQYDTVLDELAGTEPVCLEDEMVFDQWVNRRLGFLHLCGVYSRPETVRLDGASLKNEMTKSSPKGFKTLVELFKKRLVVFVGFGSEEANFLLPKLVKAIFPEESTLKNPPIFLGCCKGQSPPTNVLDGKELYRQGFPGFLPLTISQDEVEHLEQVMTAGSEKNFAIGRSFSCSYCG